jgi:hypothetical protein
LRQPVEGMQVTSFITITNLSNKLHQIRRLQKNVAYDFKAFNGSDEVEQLNVLLENNKIYDITLPEAACNRLFN